MNILFSNEVDLTGQLSTRTHILEQANNLAKFVNKIFLVTPGLGGSRLHQNIVPCEAIPKTDKRFLLPLSYRLQSLHLQFLIRRIISKEDIGIIYERHGELDFATQIGHKKGIPTVLEVNGAAPVEAELSGADNSALKRILVRELELFRMADKIITVGEEIKSYYISQGVNEQKVEVVPNGVNTDLFKPLNKERCRKRLGLDNCPLITFVGSFRPYQGLEYAIKAMPLVIASFPSAKLMLVGYAGKHRGFRFKPSIEELKVLTRKLRVEKNVIFTGKVPYEQVPIYINASDICIAPFVTETFCSGAASNLKMYEYMACRKPILTTDVGEYKKIVQSNGFGIVVKPESPEEIAQGVIRLLSDEQIRVKMRTKARNFVVNNFTWEKTASKTLKILEDVIVSSRLYR